MKKVYTWTAQSAMRSVTVNDLQAQKGTRKWVQVTANSAEEAAAAAQAEFDMIICNSANVEQVRQGDNSLFLTASIPLPEFATTDDILREAFRALSLGADAIMTARSLDVVRALAREDIPVMGHLGLVPRKSTWTGGLRAVGKTPQEAEALFHHFRALEEAGGVLVEAELICDNVMAEISKRTSIITISLGSGAGADMFTFETSDGVNTITDFSVAERDKIIISRDDYEVTDKDANDFGRIKVSIADNGDHTDIVYDSRVVMTLNDIGHTDVIENFDSYFEIW